MPISHKIMGVKRGVVFTGALSGTSTIATGSGARGICISADGASVYAANTGGNTVSIFARNTSTGALSGTSTFATGLGPYHICISADGASVYVTNGDDNTIIIITAFVGVLSIFKISIFLF